MSKLFKKEKSLDLKVYKNRRTGQGMVPLPKKKFKNKELPRRVKVTW